jgi:hypothetical protein
MTTEIQPENSKRGPRTGYERWMEDQEIPVVYGYGFEDIRDVKRSRWAAVGCDAAFIQLYGTESVTGMFVAELGPGEEIRPQRHLYELVVLVLDGQGEAEVWAPGRGSGHQRFQWQPYSLFSVPLNWHYTLRNTGTAPAVYAAVTNAPMMLDVFHDRAFIFDNDYHFASRSAQFGAEPERLTAGTGVRAVHANLISSVNELPIDPDDRRGSGARITVFEMGGNVLAGHLAEWPVRQRQKAHYHAPGAVLLITKSEGYSLMWPSQAGIRPYESGNEDKVVRVPWRDGSAFCPPGQWFHQHFNTGEVAARQVAVRYGSTEHPVGFEFGLQTDPDRKIVPTRTSLKAGGTTIDYEDEDPRIYADYRRIVGEPT